jgi:hypothetical protein
MSPEPSPLDPHLEAWVADVSYYWQRRGVSDQDRARLRVDLERDLSLALAEGATVDALVEADPNEFALELAEADGLPAASLHPDHSMTTTSLIVTALAGATAGAVASASLVYPVGLRLLDSLTLSYAGEGDFAIGLHVLAACICTAFAMAAVRWRFRFHPGIRRATLLTGLCLLLGGASSVAPTMALAASLGYNNEAPVVILEVGIVLAFCVAGLGTARWILTHISMPTRASA